MTNSKQEWKGHLPPSYPGFFTKKWSTDRNQGLFRIAGTERARTKVRHRIKSSKLSLILSLLFLIFMFLPVNFPLSSASFFFDAQRTLNCEPPILSAKCAGVSNALSSMPPSNQILGPRRSSGPHVRSLCERKPVQCRNSKMVATSPKPLGKLNIQHASWLLSAFVQTCFYPCLLSP